MTDTISIISVVLSVVAIVVGYLVHREQKRMQRDQHIKASQLADGVFHMERNFAYEGLLVEIPSALRFYGIDPNILDEDDLSTKDVAYMIMSINALSAYCRVKGISIAQHLSNNDYRKHILAQPITHKAWRYARYAFASDTRQPVDDYIMENYGVKYDAFPDYNNVVELQR